ncbi:MAG: DUF5719 family protein [Microbacteriaceae bacterium]|nr:DUF5719 family protein [Microbacteriaceae bacterium]
MATNNLAARIGGRAIAGLAGLAASACVVGAALSLPVAGVHTTPTARTVTPVPASASAACPGPLLSLASDTGTAGTSLSAASAPAVVAGGGAQAPSASSLSAPDVHGAATPAQAFEQPARGAETPVLAAAQSSTAATSDLSGFAATACAAPDYDSWLVGGATDLGSTTLVVLSNPGDVAATVDLDIYSEQGPVVANGGRGIVVAPHQQTVVPLAGLAPNASATVVHVTSTGATVTAHLQESQITGLTPQGVDWVAPTAAPADHVVIPGAVVDTTMLTSGGSDAGDGGVPVLRVLPVGGKDAKLTVSVRPESGAKAGDAQTATASHGVVSEIPLDRLAAGTYTVTVDSDVPVVAAVGTSTTAAGKGTDFTWYAAARSLTGPTAIPVADGPGRTLHLVNTSGSDILVKFTGASTLSVKVPAGGAASQPIGASGVLTTDDAQGLFASVSYAGAGQLSSYVVYPTGAAASALAVYRR